MAYKKKEYTAKTKEQIKTETKEIMDQVLTDITKYYTSVDDMLELAEFMAKFSNYSPRNMQLIKSQFPHAYACANFKTFKDAGFSPKRGEKAMKVFHPYTTNYVRDPDTQKAIPVKELTKEQQEQVKKGELEVRKRTSYYLKASAFDISQTTAKPEDLPKIFPNRQFNFVVSDENKELLKVGIQALAEKENIQMKSMGENALIDELGNAHGSYAEVINGSRAEIVMNTRNTETKGLAVAIHELAHAKLHNKHVEHSDHAPTREFEAELTSYIVCKHYGMDTSESTVPYIAQWTKNGQDIEQKDLSMMRVHETSRSFINTIDQKISELQREIEKEMQTDVKDVFVVRYGAITHTEEEIVPLSDLRERARVDTSYNDVKNAENLTHKEFIEAFNIANQLNCIALVHHEINKPMIVVQWSEADLETNKVIPFGEANAMMSKRIAEIDVVSEKAKDQGEYVPFEKTRYHLIIPKELDPDFHRMEVITMDRLDLGDGGYKSPYEQILNEKRHLSDEVKQALQQEINEYEQTRGQSNPEKLITAGNAVVSEKNQEEVDLFVSKNIERNEVKSMSNHLENVPGENRHLVTIEVLDKYIKDEEVATIRMMDADTKGFYDLAVWHVDETKRDDLYIAPMEKDGERNTVYLEDVLKHDIYEKVQDSIFEGKGNQSFVIHQENAKVSLDELVKGERYGNLIEKVEQKDFNLKDKDVELYKEMKKEGYDPIQVIEKQFGDADLVHVPSSGSNKEDVYRTEDVRTIETERSGGTEVVKEERNVPDVDKRYVGTDKMHSKEDNQVDQRKEQEREQARRRYMMQQMGGRDY
ncbi:hypothetical protein COJ48_18405 [Bacillus cereus]|nr:hypothetical protein COJ48_18405 [Bacillus cereus]PGP88739.1 hypothetical protein CN997_02440 [Bacillus cereus]